MKPEKPTLSIQYIALGYTVLYIFFIIGTLNEAEGGLQTPEGIGVLSLFILFLVGFGISWFNKLITGIIFFAWNIGMWVVELFFVEKNGGFGIIAGIPLIILGVFFILKGIERKRAERPQPGEEMKIALRLLSVIYTCLYIVVIINNFTEDTAVFYSRWSTFMLIILVLIYVAGLILSWKNELTAGIIFLLWYVGVVFTFSRYFVFGERISPYLGFVILIHGVMYIGYYRNYKVEKKAA